jgi:hypothetical protein
MKSNEFINEGWSQKYKSSINCSHPKGFSQKAHCAGKKKHTESIEMEMTCEDCGMCKTHGNLNEIKKGAKDSNGVTKCWPDKHAEGTKKGKNGGQVRACVPNESVDEAAKHGLYYNVNKRKKAGTSRDASSPKAPTAQAWKDAAKTAKNESAGEGKRTMSRAAKGYEKYGKAGMQALAKAGREGKDLDKVRDKYDKYDESIEEAANAAQQAAIAVNMKKHHVKPKHVSEDDQIDGMARGEIKAIIDNAIHIQKALEQGIELDGWMYSYVTTSNDHLNSVAEQIGNPDIEEVEANEQFDMIEAMVEELAEHHGLDSDSVWSLFETVSDNELLSEAAAWQKSSGKNKNGGLNQKGVNSYRREHPGSKLQTAVTTKPSKLKKGSKSAKRRKSFCARMKGMKKSRTSAKTARDPDSRINKSLRKWNC